MDIAKEIRQAREKLGMTQARLAQKIFVGEKTISHYETGKREPSLDKLAMLAKELGIDLNKAAGSALNETDAQFSFLLEHPQYKGKRFEIGFCAMYEFESPEHPGESFLIYVDKRFLNLWGISFDADRLKKRAYAKEGDYICLADFPEWFLALYEKTAAKHREIFCQKNGFKRRQVLHLLLDFMLEKRVGRDVYVQAESEYALRKEIVLADGALFAELMERIKAEGYDAEVCENVKGERWGRIKRTPAEVMEIIKESQEKALRWSACLLEDERRASAKGR